MNPFHPGRRTALGLNIVDVLKDIEARNRLRRDNFLPRLRVGTEVARAVNGHIAADFAAFCERTNLRYRFYQKFWARERKTRGPDWVVKGFVGNLGLNAIIHGRMWRLFRRVHAKDLAILREWTPTDGAEWGHKTIFGLLREHVRV